MTFVCKYAEMTPACFSLGIMLRHHEDLVEALCEAQHIGLMHIALFHSRRASLVTTSRHYLHYSNCKVDSYPGAAEGSKGSAVRPISNKQHFH